MKQVKRQGFTTSLAQKPLLDVTYLPTDFSQAITAFLQRFVEAGQEVIDEGKIPFYSLEELGITVDFVANTSPIIATDVAAKLPKAVERLIILLVQEATWRIAGPGKYRCRASDAAWILHKHRAASLERIGARLTAGGSSPILDLSDETCLTFAQTYKVLLKHWQKTQALYRADLEGNWKDHAKLDHPDTPDWLLKDLQKRNSQKGRPSRLAHYHAAIRSGIVIDGPKGRLVSLRTLQRVRERGDALIAVNHSAQ